MKNILIPTNFNTASLACIPDLCRQTQHTDLQLTFVHLFKVSDSISDLLMLSRRNKEYEYIPDEFYQTCENIKATFPNVKAIKIDFFYGSTLKMFRNYLEAHLVDAVLDLKKCSLKPLNKLSVDPQSLIDKCGLEMISIKPEPKKLTPRYVLEAELSEAI